MLIMSVMGVIIMLRQFFNTLVEIMSRSHDFVDELKIIFVISSSDAPSTTFILDLIAVFCTCGLVCSLSGNLELIVSNGRTGGGILCRMLFIEFQRRRGLSEFSVITSDKYFDLAFATIVLHRWHWCLQRERSRCVRDLPHVRSNCGEGF